jgi:hypothetical protein
MRKIELEMLGALQSGQPWQNGNTSTNGYGNCIAYTKDGVLVPDLETLRRWPTNTTRSRLRALGFRVQGSSILGRRG